MRRKRLINKVKHEQQRLKPVIWYVPYDVYEWDDRNKKWVMSASSGLVPIVAKSGVEAKSRAAEKLRRIYTSSRASFKIRKPVEKE